ncbi:hypothetical protein [Clostridium tarantellae]|uniref:PadR family transcriptional regulator n=1 Tax=Clostridium tarantellae TaxID=39493 RepID=A0A6I1MLL8_9CLOT|nr:hypothetical protein [Clostridium tarantellae]MPQ43633.1 hypothetical protein [Clostridium tarantellae]
MRQKLPMRFRILHFFTEVEEASVYEVLKGLKKEYGSEKFFKKDLMIEDLLSMKENGLIDSKRLELVNDELNVYYSINEDGKNLLKKYLPKAWKS